jgi:hypothetical protein
MFTNETEFAYNKTVIIDEGDEADDIEVISHDDGIIIRQFNEERDEYDVIDFTHQMFKEFLASRDQQDGAFTFSRQENT